MNHLLCTFCTLCFLIFGSFSASAQANDSDFSIDVSAEIISTIEMITIQSMDLSEADVSNNQIQINPQLSPNAGKMIAIGSPNSDIRISFQQQLELVQRNGAGNLLFNYQVAGNDQDDQSSAELLDAENRDFNFNAQGRFYLWIGGSVDISTAVPGNYQGEFTLEIDYI